MPAEGSAAIVDEYGHALGCPAYKQPTFTLCTCGATERAGIDVKFSPEETGRDAALASRRAKRKEREEALIRAGASRDQAYVMALEEAWRDEATENERLWDQADEIARLRSAIEDAAHFAELGEDVSRFLREKALGQELTPGV